MILDFTATAFLANLCRGEMDFCALAHFLCYAKTSFFYVSSAEKPSPIPCPLFSYLSICNSFRGLGCSLCL